jgi:hypothetical protein
VPSPGLTIFGMAGNYAARRSGIVRGRTVGTQQIAFAAASNGERAPNLARIDQEWPSLAAGLRLTIPTWPLMSLPQALNSGYLLAGIVALASSECKQGVLGTGPAGPRLRTSRGPEPEGRRPR